MKALIIGASVIYDYNRVLNKIDNEYDLVILADGGIYHLKHLPFTCNVLIGDFDSIKDKQLLPNDIEVITFNVEKDETDMIHCVDYAINHQCTDIDIIGATNMRFDHTYANIQTLNYILDKYHSATCRIIDEYNIIRLINNSHFILPYIDDIYISFFSFSDYCILTLKNFKYSINNYKLLNSFPIGVSNEFIKGSIAEVIVKNKALMILSDKC